MNKIKLLLKQNKLIYIMYNFLFSFFFRFIGIFVRIDNNLILFNSFGGKKFDDNPKAIYNYMKQSDNYNDYKLVWALDNPDLIDNNDVEYVKNNTWRFFITALRAKFWITNSSMERGLKFKKSKTIYINTWHGSVIKKIDAKKDRMNFNVSPPNYFYTQSKADAKYFAEKWNFPYSIMVVAGYPRNDELCNVTKKEIEQTRKKLDIPNNKKVIIYAPTFRDFDYDKNGCYIAPPIDLSKWKKELSKDYILLFRAHYEINRILNIKDDEFIRNVTDYPHLNDLLKISDIMISDYSSIMIDYSILERPIFCYAYDYEKYNRERGTAYDLRTELPNGVITDEDELIKQIKNCNYKQQQQKTRKFKEKHVEVCGNSAAYIDKIILENK